MEVGERTCSSVVELAKSLFVCYAASNDITWFTTKAGVNGVSSGFCWPSLWNMSSRKRLRDSLRPKRNLPLINSSAFMPNHHRPAALCAVCLWHFSSEVVAVLHQTTYTSVMFFDFLKPNPVFFQYHRSVSWKLFRCVRCPIQLQELLTRRIS